MGWLSDMNLSLFSIGALSLPHLSGSRHMCPGRCCHTCAQTSAHSQVHTVPHLLRSLGRSSAFLAFGYWPSWCPGGVGPRGGSGFPCAPWWA